jgi:hypothetical protein
VGYDEQGRFMGLLADDFQAGGLNWNPLGTPIPADAAPPFPEGAHSVNTFTRPRPGPNRGQPYQATTHDLGMRFADGSYSTIVRERNNEGVICGGPNIDFEDDELVIMRDAVGISARSGQLDVSAPSAGGSCPCAASCLDFEFNPTSDYRSGPGALTARYGFGEVQGGFRTVVWFVTANPQGEGELRRAEFTGDTCPSRQACGGVVADFAESLLTQIWRWDSALNRWVQAGQAPVQASEDRLRVDIELVLRSESETRTTRPQVRTKLADANCVPGPCDGSNRDGYARVAYRTSVEIMNSGAMQVE